MEFLEKLELTDDSKRIKHVKDFDLMGYQSFKHIIFKDVSLSLQASSGHYCSPRAVLNDLSDYQAWEFALIRDNEFINVTDLFADLTEYEQYESVVYCYVPTELVEKLYQTLKIYGCEE